MTLESRAPGKHLPPAKIVGAPGPPPDADMGADDRLAARQNGRQLWVHGRI